MFIWMHNKDFAYIVLFYFNYWVGWLCCVDGIVPDAIHIPVAIKFLVSGTKSAQYTQICANRTMKLSKTG